MTRCELFDSAYQLAQQKGLPIGERNCLYEPTCEGSRCYLIAPLSPLELQVLGDLQVTEFILRLQATQSFLNSMQGNQEVTQ